MLSPFFTNSDTKFPSANEHDPTSLLNELERIHAEIEHDLAASPVPFSAKAICNELFAVREKYEPQNDFSNELPPYEPDRWHKLDEAESISNINSTEKTKRNNGLANEVSDLVRKYQKQKAGEDSFSPAPVSSPPEQFQEQPTLIPIHSKRQSTVTYHQPHAKTKQIVRNVCRPNKHSSQDISKNDVLPTLSWKWLSQYENEATMRFTSNFGAILILIGWGGAVCGMIIFLRAFFTASKSWTIYGIPFFAIGLFCLALGILLNILSRKMRQINELKQRLTAQRIHDNSVNKSQRTLKSKQRIQPAAKKNHSKSSANPIKKDDKQTIYRRLLGLKIEIDNLLQQCRKFNSRNE
ncbi:MAG: DUF308 domain-containing protein [Planctomycetaceae bacterium]|jgi:hypothetical protein|nr:DUF308 domain-containing protein [Planctomycetaceae bacterium]